MAENQRCKDQSVFDPLPWSREYEHRADGAALRGAFARRRLDDWRDNQWELRRHRT
jgi:hypothetical protein